MRIKTGEKIREVTEVYIRDDEDIRFECAFYKTGKDTKNIANQLLEKGYADLTDYETIR